MCRTRPRHLPTPRYHHSRDMFQGNGEKLDSTNRHLICKAAAAPPQTGTVLALSVRRGRNVRDGAHWRVIGPCLGRDPAELVGTNVSPHQGKHSIPARTNGHLSPQGEQLKVSQEVSWASGGVGLRLGSRGVTRPGRIFSPFHHLSNPVFWEDFSPWLPLSTEMDEGATCAFEPPVRERANRGLTCH